MTRRSRGKCSFHFQAEVGPLSKVNCRGFRPGKERECKFKVIVRMVMGNEKNIEVGEIMDGYNWICLSRPCHFGANATTVAGMKKIGLDHESST